MRRPTIAGVMPSSRAAAERLARWAQEAAIEAERERARATEAAAFYPAYPAFYPRAYPRPTPHHRYRPYRGIW